MLVRALALDPAEQADLEARPQAPRCGCSVFDRITTERSSIGAPGLYIATRPQPAPQMKQDTGFFS